MIYDFKVKKTNGEEILLENIKERFFNINTASGCGLHHNMKGYKIYDEYKDKVLNIRFSM